MPDSPREEHHAISRTTGRTTARTTGRIAGRAIRRRAAALPAWWPLPLCALVGVVGGASYGALAAPDYAATSYVVAAPAKGTDPATALGFAQAYGRISTSTSTLAAAHAAAGVPVRTLGRHVRTETSPESPMIGVTGTATRPGTAADIANAVAAALTTGANSAAESTGVRLVMFSKAVAPSAAVSPSVPVSVAVGGCAGGLVGALALLVRPRRKQWHTGTALPAPAQATGSDALAEPAQPAQPKEHV
ncbi:MULTISPECIES: lipopolysaccharide biosynthesis protein [unclassified Streptomyces]|uniref:lipopolysaccharide biosynthesis protein n=1 Tax=unclassified Streptomyces TaxID=2593676 RepID=UPI002E15A92F|nr:lipopolysaccharide biosynthesis protein [Streptomyces sp. NBC_01197]WSS50604.1 lipopolysaccharide biosynthesis protein [Streptomyces sp. NBC_01180]